MPCCDGNRLLSSGSVLCVSSTSNVRMCSPLFAMETPSWCSCHSEAVCSLFSQRDEQACLLHSLSIPVSCHFCQLCRVRLGCFIPSPPTSVVKWLCQNHFGVFLSTENVSWQSWLISRVVFCMCAVCRTHQCCQGARAAGTTLNSRSLCVPGTDARRLAAFTVAHLSHLSPSGVKLRLSLMPGSGP